MSRLRLSLPVLLLTAVIGLAARGETPAAFGWRCIPPGGVAPRSNTPGILTRPPSLRSPVPQLRRGLAEALAKAGRALPGGRIATLGATLGFHHGLTAAPPEVLAPAEESSTRFAVLGDSGTGDDEQQEVADVMAKSREVFPFDFAIMLGDNLYGRERPQDYREKFEIPYRALLDGGVEFYASLGNHDDTNQRFYEPFHMNGRRYYSFKKGPVRFFVLDSNYMDRDQLEWFERELSQSTDRWKIAYFHHPLYSSGGRHGSELDLRELLEPLMIANGVDVVFAGHEHFYERIKPQRGIYYFISGAAGKLRRGDIESTPLTAAGFDEDRSFMLVEITDDALHFQAISRTGRRVDDGVLPRPADPVAADTAAVG